jgi:VCBS repeat protein/FG-GAP repeat protein
MRCVSVAVVLLCVLFILSGPVQAQVSFFQPPTFTGSGNQFVADFNGDGKPDILTSDGTMNLGNGDGTFKLGTPVSVSSSSVLAVADFNGDGKPDVLEQGTGTLLVLLGNGDGTFQAPVSTASGASLSPVAAGDLNGDGKADVVGVYNSSLMVYIGKGDGTFAPGVAYNLASASAGPTILSLGDFNSDGKTDVAVTITGDNVAGQEIVFLGRGDGTLQPAKISTGVFYPYSSAVGDFNGDGKLDLALTSTGYCNGSCSIPASVYILLGDGDGTFQAPTVAFAGAGALIAADVNGDGKLDLVLQGDATAAQVNLGNGDGTFSGADAYMLNLTPPFDLFGVGLGMAIADFNLDGRPDIAAGSAVLLGNGDGSFQGIPLGVVPDYTGPAVVGHFGNNGAPGVAMLSNQQNGGTYSYLVYILSNNGSGQLSLAYTYSLQLPGYAIATADFNGDGNLDLAVIGIDPVSQDWSYSVLLGNGDGSFQSPVFYPQGVAASNVSIMAADFNSDHKADLVVALGPDSGSLAVLIGNGDGTFAPAVSYYDAGFSPLLVADFNSDGKLDIAAGDWNQSTQNPETTILYGNGDGTFQAAVFPATLNGFAAQFAGDLNNDGKPDFVSSFQVALNNGDGTFTLLPPFDQVLGLSVFGLADLNGDGKLDMVAGADLFSSRITETGVLLGNGDGTFGPLIAVPTTGVLPSAVLIADMNADGRSDIVFPWTTGVTAVNGVAVTLNTTQPGFALSAKALSPTPVTAGSTASSTITVTPTFGYSAAVTLSCPGLPSGASCAFNPPSVANSSGTSALTITTSAALAAGTYKVQVQGSSGSIVNSVSDSLVVQAVPDFSIGAASGSPTSQTVTAGQTASFSLAFASTGSFSGTVNLSCAVKPAETPAPTCSVPATVQITSSGTQTATVKVGTTAAATSGVAPYLMFPTGPVPLSGLLVLLGSAWVCARNRKRLRALAAPIVVLAFAFSVGCGGSGSSTSTHTTPGTPTGTYTATVTATSGSTSHNMALQVVVQ